MLTIVIAMLNDCYSYDNDLIAMLNDYYSYENHLISILNDCYSCDNDLIAMLNDCYGYATDVIAMNSIPNLSLGNAPHTKRGDQLFPTGATNAKPGTG
ncbi:hypothetical protein CEXT_725651 [Caerostris extrusa]|uniref:Uncharacterized protein n=1 Tax=Caerostris extrusa TaxID=172846 RepID=A0AAV4X3A8_CAEEX|nr:hypothetical protein CEXT_725651 [Caerostris extrusa]